MAAAVDKITRIIVPFLIYEIRMHVTSTIPHGGGLQAILSHIEEVTNPSGRFQADYYKWGGVGVFRA